ncbi:MAG TPA: CPBP family intramembrane glutamic endopeptidase [Chitinophaga sp.]
MVPDSHAAARRAVMLYLLLTFAISTGYYLLIIRAGSLGAYGGAFTYGLMWSPAAGAFISSALLRRPIRALGWKWPGWRLMLGSYIVPLLYATLAYAIIWGAGWGGFPNMELLDRIRTAFHWQAPDWLMITLYFCFDASIGLLFSMASATGEEIGWRGFLAPAMYTLTGGCYTKTSLITGLIWALWHYPILLFADYNNGTPAWYGLGCFTVLVVSIAFIMTWFRLKSGSLWTAAMLHASHNLFIQDFFTRLTRSNAHTKYFIDEFGIVLPLFCAGFAFYYWRRRHELPPLPPNPLPS